MNIRRRIWALPVIATIIFGLGIGASAYLVNDAHRTINEVGNVDFPVLQKSKLIGDEIQAITEEFKNAVSDGEPKKLDQIETRGENLKSEIRSLGKIQKYTRIAERLNTELDNYLKPASQSARIMLGAPGDAAAAIKAMQDGLKTLQDDVAATLKQSQADFDSGIAASASNIEHVLVVMIVSAALVTLGLMISAYFVVRSIWNQLGGEPEYARRIMTAIADGDLANKISVRPGDETSLLAAIVQMRSRLESLLSDIKRSAQAISSATADIASGNSDLSSRTEHQAESLARTAQALHDLTKMVKDNDGNASEASVMASQTAEVTTTGNSSVIKVVSTMQAIHESSKKISDITTVIDSIAFQTNILALNAAVEAARAGEQGRGFAVVASEVRNLAQRSAAAAKEIKEIIVDSSMRTSEGTALAAEAGETMRDILSSVNKVSSIMSSISTSSSSQRSGIELVNQSMGEIDGITQQNAALVEQAAGAAMALSDQAQELTRSLGVFRMAESSEDSNHTKPRLIGRA
jgi:methyl-accepting chemotaxis protein